MQGTTDGPSGPNPAPDEQELSGALLARLRGAIDASSPIDVDDQAAGVARMIDVARRLAGTREGWR